MDVSKRRTIPVQALDKLEQAWQKTAPGLSKKPVKEQFRTVANDPNFRTIAGASGGSAATTAVVMNTNANKDKIKQKAGLMIKRDPLAAFEEAVEIEKKGLLDAVARTASAVERATPKIQGAGKKAQEWRDGIDGLPTTHPLKGEVTRLLDSAAKLGAGNKYKKPPVKSTTVAKLDEAIAKAVSTKLRGTAQQSMDQSQMMQQAMQDATNALAPKVAMEVERIRQEQMMAMHNDQQALQGAGPQAGPAGPSGPQQYTGGPAMVGAQISGPSGPSVGPQQY